MSHTYRKWWKWFRWPPSISLMHSFLLPEKMGGKTGLRLISRESHCKEVSWHMMWPFDRFSIEGCCMWRCEFVSNKPNMSISLPSALTGWQEWCTTGKIWAGFRPSPPRLSSPDNWYRKGIKKRGSPSLQDLAHFNSHQTSPTINCVIIQSDVMNDSMIYSETCLFWSFVYLSRFSSYISSHLD